MKRKKDKQATFLRNFIFGVEDSLVSTVGLLSGVAVAGLSREDIFLTGIVLIFVEAFSMGVGSYLSEESVNEFSQKKYSVSLPSSIVMFISYFLAGFIPLSSYLFFPVNQAFYTSIAFSLVSLFILGAFSSLVYKSSNLVKNAIRMFVVGGLAILVGVLVGKFVNR